MIFGYYDDCFLERGVLRNRRNSSICAVNFTVWSFKNQIWLFQRGFKLLRNDSYQIRFKARQDASQDEIFVSSYCISFQGLY